MASINCTVSTRWSFLLPLQCMETLVQFAIFLESHLSAEEYASKFPDLETLQGTYHLPPDIAFCLMRPQLNHAVQVGVVTWGEGGRCVGCGKRVRVWMGCGGEGEGGWCGGVGACMLHFSFLPKGEVPVFAQGVSRRCRQEELCSPKGAEVGGVSLTRLIKVMRTTHT